MVCIFQSKCIWNLIYFPCLKIVLSLDSFCFAWMAKYAILSFLWGGKQTFNVSLVIRICYNVNRWNSLSSAILWWPRSWHPHPQRQIIEPYVYVGLESSIISCVTVNKLVKLLNSSYHIFKNWNNSTSKGCCMWLHRLRFTLWITFEDTKSTFYNIIKFHVLYLKKVYKPGPSQILQILIQIIRTISKKQITIKE